MHWRSNKLTKKEEGQRRVRRKFLLWPRKFGRDWYWLQYANILEEVTEFDVGGHDEWGCYAYQWREIAIGD